MEGIEFDEQNIAKTRLRTKPTSKLAQLVLKTGLVKDRVQADLVLLGGSILLIIISLVFIFSSSSDEFVADPSLEQPAEIPALL